MKALQKQFLNLEVESYQETTDQEFFTYMQQNQLELSSFIHVLYVAGHKSNSIIIGVTYQQFCYDILGMTFVNCTGELNMPVFWTIIYGFQHAKRLLGQAGNFYKCQIATPDYIVMSTGNNDMKYTFE